jgi:small GTP-binding protein
MSWKTKLSYDVLVKILLIGDSGVGKSNMLLKFTDDVFSENYMTTIGIDFKTKNLELDKKTVKLQIWDTAGQERFRTITQAYYRGAQGILIVYDITDRQSFDDVERWILDMESHTNSNVCKILIGNKKDLVSKRVVTTKQGEEFARKHGMVFFETSAKDGTGLYDAFSALSLQIMNVNKSVPKPIKPTPIKIKKCCNI